MYIKSVVLDGFKSYGKRTEVNGFDPLFNAITGLNGTGKSNILDAICFVLGISQLSNVRVGTLQDLVYKCGQSNVTKATVSITFDNRDKSQCPVGFVNFDEITITRQVMIGGKNKYMINGTNVQNKRINDLFCSVHLNVNNPHFLIMQGRVTKVLNMKPPEILGMIEEAAGTKTYEAKRQQTQKTIEKKELKLQELTKVAEEEINPKLNRLREERNMYREFQRIERELERVTNSYALWQCMQTQKVMQQTVEELEEKQGDVKNIENKILQNKKKAEEIENKITEYHEKDADKNKELKEAETKLKEKEKILASINAQEKMSKENVIAEEKKLKQLVKSLSDDENSLKAKDAEMNKLSDMFQGLKDAEATDSAAFVAAQKKFEAINAGMEIGDDGEAATLQELLISAKQNAVQASTEIKQASMQLEHCQTQLNEKQKELKTLSADFRKDKSEMDNLESQVKNIQRSLDNLNYDQNKIGELRNKNRTILQETRNLRDRIERFEAQYPQTKFEYTDPEKNFNRRSVKGVVCKLVKLKDYNTALALETGAGGKLYNVIVDNEITSKKLLKNGQLRRRTTIIPLNKIRGSSIKPTVAAHAQRLVGSENVQTALSLVQYDKELQAAMEYIFGGFFVCRDLNIARKVAFDESILCTCVTLEGDVVNPAGVLSGGSVSKNASFLALLREYDDNLKTLKSKEQELKQIETDLEKLAQAEEKYSELKRRYEIRSHEFTVFQQRIQQTSHYHRQEEVDNLKQTIAELTESVKSCKEKEKVNKAKALDIENKIKKSKGGKEEQLKEAEAEMKQLKKKAENSKNLWKQKEQDYESLKLEINDLQQAIISDKEQIQKCEENIVELKRQCEEAITNTKETKTDVSSLQIDYKELKSSFAAKNKEIQKMLQQKTDLVTQVSEYELEIKKRSHDIAQLEDKCKNYNAKKAELEKRIPEITRSREAEEMDDNAGHELGIKMKRLQEQRDTLRRTVNAKALNLCEQEEKQYKDLMKRKKVIESDKLKMLSLIEDIDKKKTDTLNIASAQISKDFGLIFSTLLPGTTAKLQTQENRPLLDGLEIKVSIGGIWKESLSELSGGQKSLVALSLILAMLLFKPAPIYILDEVDAALDLSHTQNIGTMLRKHFNRSQFIIVSLKDGMFNNANVLFRTQFVDGMSAVTRDVNKSRK